jgi:hypothetical protein
MDVFIKNGKIAKIAKSIKSSKELVVTGKINEF